MNAHDACRAALMGFLLAATLASEAKWQEAKVALSHALKIDPENAKAHELGQALASAQAQP